jgi:hypothetical protein
VFACHVFGHRFRFAADGATLRWACDRCGHAGGEKVYDSAEDAQRYAAAFDRRDSDRTTNHTTLSTLPLWIVRKLRGDRVGPS